MFRGRSHWPPTRDLFVSSVILCVAAAAAYGALRLICGERPAYVHVRWSAGIDEPERRELERVHLLTRGELRKGRTWGYYLTDLSRQNIRTLVTNSAAEDTHYIHRTAFRVWRTAPRGAYVGPRRAWIGPLLEALTMLFLALGVVALGVAALGWAGQPAVLRRPLTSAAWVLTSPAALFAVLVQRGPRWIEARVVPASAESLAVFRIVFGVALLGYFISKPVSAEWIGLAAPESAIHRVVLPAYEAVPVVADWIRPWMVFWTVLFVAGAMARTSFVMMTIGVIAWGLLYTMRAGAHSVQVLLVAMLCLLWSRWGDTWSVDAWWRRRRRAATRSHPGAQTAPGRRYGYPMWILGFVLGTSLAAAAFAKLREGGFAWITNGTVKYHFLTDSPQAPVDWGLRIAQYDGLAIFMSFVAVAIEALVIVGVCSTRYRYRLLAGAATLVLLVGFELFQGLFWPAWWILLFSFLPWHLRPAAGSRQAREAQTPPEPQHSNLAMAQMVVIILVVAQQAAASALKIELEPFLSAYDMYSSTYASPADYESKSGLFYWMVAGFADGTTERCRVSGQDADAVRAGSTPQLAQLLKDCFHEAAPSIRTVSVEGSRRAVDWAHWRLGDEIRIPLAGPISVAP